MREFEGISYYTSDDEYCELAGEFKEEEISLKDVIGKYGASSYELAKDGLISECGFYGFDRQDWGGEYGE